MPRLPLVVLMLFLLGVAFAALDPATGEALVLGTATLWDACVEALCGVAEVNYAIQTGLWMWFPGKLRAVLGGLQCLGFFLFLAGLFAVGGARHIWRRYL